MSANPITLSRLEQYLAKAEWILKGPVDASDFKVYIFPLLFFKRISDVYDEEYRRALAESDGDVAYASFAEHHRFQDGRDFNRGLCAYFDYYNQARDHSSLGPGLPYQIYQYGPKSLS